MLFLEGYYDVNIITTGGNTETFEVGQIISFGIYGFQTILAFSWSTQLLGNADVKCSVFFVVALL